MRQRFSRHEQKKLQRLHRAPLGTHERFIGGEQLPASSHRRLRAGNFPLWLAPEQVRVLTLNDEKLVAYAKEIHRELRAHEVRAEADFSPDPIKAKIAEAEKAKVHTMLVIGGRDMDAVHRERAGDDAQQRRLAEALAHRARFHRYVFQIVFVLHGRSVAATWRNRK